MEIYTLNRLQAGHLLPHYNAIFISITCPGDEMPKLVDGWKAVLHLQIDDVSDDHGGQYALFNEDHARQIVEFVFGHLPETLFINCDAGLSRSAGVAVALTEIILERYIGKDRGFMLYNKHVARVIRNYWYMLNSSNRKWMLDKLEERHVS